ncbi:MAG: asparaginase [Lachnospiraceae bacterium]|nr:asparaginase [Lachnospiraceae bacterium]
MLKILVIFTGGTIGSTKQNQWISTDSQMNHVLIEKYQENAHRSVTFTCQNPFTLLSEDMTGESLHQLGAFVLENSSREYDGIIITHGSDTIQYSAAMLSYALGNIPLPILLVCSNYVLDDPRANGMANFAAAVDFIASSAGNGVFVPYRNADGNIIIHRGTRILPHLPYQDDLVSILDQYYGRMESNGHFQPNPNVQPGNGKFCALCLPPQAGSHILRLWPYPGSAYPMLTEPYPAAILLDTYHSGTLCSATPGMKDFFTQAWKLQIPVFLTGANIEADYDSVKAWNELHIITLPQASPIAMYMKLWMLLSTFPDIDRESLAQHMNTSMQGDLIS